MSLSFTAVAVVGMIFMGLALFFRFSANTNAQMAENSQRVLAQVNLNLDAYLRRMMRLSDTAYYSVIKDADLAEEDLSCLLYTSWTMFSPLRSSRACSTPRRSTLPPSRLIPQTT